MIRENKTLKEQEEFYGCKNFYIFLIQRTSLIETKQLYDELSAYSKRQFLLWLIDTEFCDNWKEILKYLI